MIDTFIVAVPWADERAERARELAAATSGTVIWDERRDAMHTWRKALRAAGDSPSIILEDDIRLTANWREKIERVISGHPDLLIQFFSRRKADLTIGSRLEPGSSYLMNQCYYLPAGMARAIDAYADQWIAKNREHPTGTDLLIASYLKDNRKKYWLHVPSLVQHEPWESHINGRRPRNRQSQTFREA